MATEITIRLRVEESAMQWVDMECLDVDLEGMFDDLYGVECTAELVDVEEV